MIPWTGPGGVPAPGNGSWQRVGTNAWGRRPACQALCFRPGTTGRRDACPTRALAASPAEASRETMTAEGTAFMRDQLPAVLPGIIIHWVLIAFWVTAIGHHLLLWVRWWRHMRSLCTAVAPLIGATAPNYGRSSWLLLQRYEIEMPEDSAVLMLKPVIGVETQVSIRFEMSHSPGLWGRLSFDRGASRPQSRLTRILNRPLFAAGESTVSGDSSFDGMFAARSYDGARLWAVVTPQVRQALVTLVGGLSVLNRLPGGRGLDIRVDAGELRFDLRLPAGWLPSAEFVAEIYHAARATHLALEQACQS